MVEKFESLERTVKAALDNAAPLPKNIAESLVIMAEPARMLEPEDVDEVCALLKIEQSALGAVTLDSKQTKPLLNDWLTYWKIQLAEDLIDLSRRIEITDDVQARKDNKNVLHEGLISRGEEAGHYSQAFRDAVADSTEKLFSVEGLTQDQEHLRMVKNALRLILAIETALFSKKLLSHQQRSYIAQADGILEEYGEYSGAIHQEYKTILNAVEEGGYQAEIALLDAMPAMATALKTALAPAIAKAKAEKGKGHGA